VHSYKWEQQRGRDASFDSSSRQGRARDREFGRSRSASSKARSAARLSASAAKLHQGSSGADSDDSVKFVRGPKEELGRVRSVRHRSTGRPEREERCPEEAWQGGVHIARFEDEKSVKEERSAKGEASSRHALKTESAFGSDTSVEARPHRRPKQRDPAFGSDSSFSFMKGEETIEEGVEGASFPSPMQASRPRSHRDDQRPLPGPVDIAPPNLRTGPLGDRQFVKPSRARAHGKKKRRAQGGTGQHQDVCSSDETGLPKDSRVSKALRNEQPNDPKPLNPPGETVGVVAALSPPIKKSSFTKLFGGGVKGPKHSVGGDERPPFRNVEFNSGDDWSGSFAQETAEDVVPKKSHRERRAHRSHKENEAGAAGDETAPLGPEEVQKGGKKKARARSPFKVAIFGKSQGEKDLEGTAQVAPAVERERSTSPFPVFERGKKAQAEYMQEAGERRGRSKSPFKMPRFGKRLPARGGEESETRARSKSPLREHQEQAGVAQGDENGAVVVERSRSKSPFRMPRFGWKSETSGDGDSYRGEGLEKRARSKSPFSRLHFGRRQEKPREVVASERKPEPLNPSEANVRQERLETRPQYRLPLPMLEESQTEGGERVEGQKPTERARSKSPFRMPKFGKKGVKEEPALMKDQNHVAAVQLLFVKGHLPGGDLALLNPVVRTRGRSKSPFKAADPVPRATQDIAPEGEPEGASRAQRKGRSRSPFRIFSGKNRVRISDAQYGPTRERSEWTEGLQQQSDDELDVTSAPAFVQEAKEVTPPMSETVIQSSDLDTNVPMADRIEQLEKESDAQLEKATEAPEGLGVLEEEVEVEEPLPVLVSRISAEEDAKKAPKRSPLKRARSRQHRWALGPLFFGLLWGCECLVYFRPVSVRLVMCLVRLPVVNKRDNLVRIGWLDPRSVGAC
jgi:hypothetical protein